jgi:hypothetical protein
LVNNFIDEYSSFKQTTKDIVSIPCGTILDDHDYKLDIFSDIIKQAFSEANLSEKSNDFVESFNVNYQELNRYDFLNNLFNINSNNDYVTLKKEYIQSTIADQYFNHISV